MAKERKFYIVLVDSPSIVGYPDKACSTFFDIDCYGSRPCIDRIFNKLLYNGGGPLYHFAGSDFINCILVEYCYFRHSYLRFLKFSISAVCLLYRYSRNIRKLLPSVLYFVLKPVYRIKGIHGSHVPYVKISEFEYDVVIFDCIKK